MEPDKVNRWLTLGANIGVLIGIILLVVELNQNRDMIRAQTRNDISQQLSTRLQSLATNDQLASAVRRGRDGDELTVDEEFQVYLYLVANLRDWENIHYQYRHGMFDEQEFDAEKNVWGWLINHSKSFQQVWCSTRQNYSPEFVAELGQMIIDDVCALSQSE
jgi:hypothetical protein